MKIFSVDFDPVYPVGNCLIIAAKDEKEALAMADNMVTHTSVSSISEVDISKPRIIVYQSGDY